MDDKENNGYGMDEQLGFNEFLLKEYDNIAQAHFNTKQTLTAFFRYYLLIVALPLPFIALFIEKVIRAGASPSIQQSLISAAADLAPFLSFAIGVIGIFVMLYMANLHFEALLYARQVNGIRWHFYKLAKERGQKDFDKISVLPIDKTKPEADGKHSFSYVVWVFIVIDTLYFLYPIYHCLNGSQKLLCTMIILSFVVFVISIFVHKKVFKFNAKRYEGKWQSMFDASLL